MKIQNSELEGRFSKWNNNAGKVLSTKAATAARKPSALGAIVEGDSEDEVEEEAGDDADLATDVPQCFSHFTHCISGGKQLVCDLQGVWNVVDGCLMTDPVIHYNSGTRRHVNGSTDKGQDGIDKFFETHRCGPLCRKLGLSSRQRQGAGR